mmetsp:Transcript_36758/g.118168  ORF Transcript_36758/g.118168 Transcript_36758/m.118168 type:complete len:213 (+) Transcript_36758:694-1332(+)
MKLTAGSAAKYCKTSSMVHLALRLAHSEEPPALLGVSAGRGRLRAELHAQLVPHRRDLDGRLTQEALDDAVEKPHLVVRQQALGPQPALALEVQQRLGGTGGGAVPGAQLQPGQSAAPHRAGDTDRGIGNCPRIRPVAMQRPTPAGAPPRRQPGDEAEPRQRRRQGGGTLAAATGSGGRGACAPIPNVHANLQTTTWPRQHRNKGRHVGLGN